MNSQIMKTSFLQSDTPKETNIIVSYVFIVISVGLYLASVVLDLGVIFFLVSGGIFLFVVALWRLEIACLLIPLALANPISLKETDSNLIISEYVLLIIFGAFFLRILFFRNRYFFPRDLLIPSIGIIIISIISLGKAQYFQAGINPIIRYIEVFFVFSFLIVNVFTNDRSIRQAVFFTMIAGLIASLVGIGQYVTSNVIDGETKRVYGMLGPGYGAVVSSTLMLCVGILLYAKKNDAKLLALIITPIAGLALLVSQTRAWVGSFIIVLIIMLLIVNRKQLKKSLIVLLTIMAIVLLLLTTNFFGLIEENKLLTTIFSAFRFGKRVGEYSTDDISMLLRFSVWLHAFGIFLQNPLLGIGVGNLRFGSYFPPHLTAPREGVGYVDSQYIQFFVELGIVGGLVWLFYCFNSIKIGINALKLTKNTSLQAAAFGLFGSMLIFLIGGLFWTITPYHEFFAFLVLIISLLKCIERAAGNSSSDNEMIRL